MSFKTTILTGLIASSLVCAFPAWAAGTLDVTVSWTAPTTNTDGTPLTDLRNFQLREGVSAGSYARSFNTGLNTNHELTLDLGLHCFVVSAFDTSGNESPPSAELCVTLTEAGPIPTPTPIGNPPGGVANGRAAPNDFSGSGVSNILTVSRKSRGKKADLLFKLYSSSDMSLISETSLGKFDKSIPVPADYDGDGKSNLAVVERSRKNWNWKILQSDNSISETTFGAKSDTPLGGCYLDSDVKADMATLDRRGKLSFFSSAEGTKHQVALKSAPKQLHSIACADLGGDGVDELIVLGSAPAAAAKKKVSVKAKEVFKLYSFDVQSGELLDSKTVVRPRGLISGDLNNDALAEPAVVKKGAIDFYLAGESSATPVTVGARGAIIASKLTASGARVGDGLLYSKAGSPNVFSFKFADLSENNIGMTLDRRHREALVAPVNSGLGR